MTRPFEIGIAIWSHATTWKDMMAGAELVDQLGFDHLWTVDHWLAPHGDPDQPVFDGWMTLAGWAMRTTRIRLCLFVAANTFRPPGHTAKLVSTLDHMSDGRAMLGLGAGWFTREHEAYGIEFGAGPGQRIGWLDESAGICRRLLDGERMTVTEGRYRIDDLELLPRPVQEHVPLVIGGGGEKKTLRVVARHADIWNAFGSEEAIERKVRVLGEHCAAVGRDPADIRLTLGAQVIIRDSAAEARAVHEAQLAHNKVTPENTKIDPAATWTGTVDDIMERIGAYRALGISGLIVEMPAPIDHETLYRLAQEVRPRIGAAG
jgi:alkanesulfonate monooxygenase SsuD/methylene tetrahydromethanopterin reductase-like flavin-dependent oxidoreductase (luciferase family)